MGPKLIFTGPSSVLLYKPMIERWANWHESLANRLWETDIVSAGKSKVFFIKSLRVVFAALREISEGQLALRATSLVYTTLLSLVPLLAVSFSVLKAFGVHNKIEPVLYNFLEPLGDSGGEITSRIIVFVEKTNVGVLGSVGMATLILTVISLIQKIEDAFNYIWNIKKNRSFARRFSDYLSILLIGPLFTFAAIGVTASIMSATVIQKLAAMEPFGTVIYVLGQLSPYFLISGAFAFTYAFLPNTRVRFRSALVGGVAAGVLWQVLGWAFAVFVVSSTRYAAIYSSFAILILFMMWIYVSWLIVLVGAEISFFHQFPQFLTARKGTLYSTVRLKEKLAYLIMFLIGYNFYHHRRPWTMDSMVAYLKVPVGPFREVMSVLAQSNFVSETADYPPAYIPARDMGTITLLEICNSVRGCHEDGLDLDAGLRCAREINMIIAKTDDAVKTALEGKDLRSLVLACREDLST